MLTADATVLRPPLPEDKATLSRLRNDLATQTMLMVLPRPNSPKRVDEWVEGALADPQRAFFVVADAGTNACVGFIQVQKMDFVHGTGDLGIALDGAARGKGHAAAAIRLVERYVKDTYNLRKVVLQVLAANEPAVACYKKCGYTSVGVLAQHFYHAGAYHDVLIMEHLLEPAR